MASLSEYADWKLIAQAATLLLALLLNGAVLVVAALARRPAPSVRRLIALAAAVQAVALVLEPVVVYLDARSGLARFGAEQLWGAVLAAHASAGLVVALGSACAAGLLLAALLGMRQSSGPEGPVR